MLAKNGFRGSKVANCPSCFICSAKKLWISDEIMSTGMFKHFRSNVQSRGIFNGHHMPQSSTKELKNSAKISKSFNTLK